MNKAQIFNHGLFGDLPVIVVDGVEWLGATEVARALSFSDPYKAINNHVDSEDWTVHPVLTEGGQQSKKFINESGLYNLIFGAAKQGNNPNIQEKAKQFKRWVTSDVLPTIRKHGAYLTSAKIEEVLLNPDTIIQLATQVKMERAEKEKALKKIEIQRPKVVFAEALEISKDSILVKELAGILKQKGVDIGQNRLFEWLRDRGYLCKKYGDMYNLPTQKSMELGLFEIKKGIRTDSNGEMRQTRTVKVTGKGQVYLVNKVLEEEGQLVY